MKKQHLIVLIFFIFINPWNYLSGQDITTDNGPNKIFYPNGKVSSEGLMRNGKPDGFWKTYYPSGIIKSVGNRRNHLLDSIWVFFNETGDTLQKVSYMLGKRNGYSIEYNLEASVDPMNRGKIVSRELYINDKREGISQYFYTNGKLKEEVHYENNKRNGIAREFDKEGVLITLQTFNNGFLTNREKLNRKDEKGLKQGIWKDFYANGRTRSEINYKDDIFNGPFKEFDEVGNIKVLLQYNNGILIEEKDTAGMEIEIRNKFDSNGNLIYSGSYRKDISVGIHRFYDTSGKVINAVLYNDDGTKSGEGIITNEGKKEGGWKYYNANGTIRSIGRYNNNLLTGDWKYFYDNGKTEQTGIFKNGKTDGVWKWYFKNGNVKREEEYFDGKEEGIYVEYDSLGAVIVNGTYFDGQKEGEWVSKLGDYSEKGKYVGDLKDGKWQTFYSDGKLMYEGNYIQGNPDGEHIFYYNNGQIKEIDYYVMGIAEKNWKKYDENGVLFLTITYKDNKEFRINGERVEFSNNDIKLIE
jgi:antitoxin component YwqK of YwqJK toxin-antitoxin module